MTATDLSKTSTAAESPETDAASVDDYVPVIKNSSVTKPDAQAAKLAAIAERGKFAATGKARTNGRWISGWCGPNECRDGMIDPATGKPTYRCLGIGENGVKITPRYLFCACTCHRTNPAAVPVPVDEDDSAMSQPVGTDEDD